jgi:hypothetical protein
VQKRKNETILPFSKSAEPRKRSFRSVFELLAVYAFEIGSILWRTHGASTVFFIHLY